MKSHDSQKDCATCACTPDCSSALGRADVVVVGGGVVGLAAGVTLARDFDVVVIEQNDATGIEASAQNAGMLRSLVADDTHRALAVRSLAVLRETFGTEASEAIVEWSGGVVASVGANPALETAAQSLAAQGIPVRRLTATELGRKVPGAAQLRAEHIWFLPQDGTTDGPTLCDALARQFESAGGRLLKNTEVTEVTRHQQRVNGVLTSAGRLDASRVVVAAGAWAGRFASHLGISRPLEPVARHLFPVAHHPLWRPRQPWVWVDDAGVYLSSTEAGWLCSPCDQEPQDPPSGKDSTLPARRDGEARAYHKLAATFPAVGEVEFKPGWRGLRTFAPDLLPLLGPDPEIPGLWWAAGLGGAGVTSCLAVGEFLSLQMRGEEVSWVDPAALDPGRPSVTGQTPVAAWQPTPATDEALSRDDKR